MPAIGDEEPYTTLCSRRFQEQRARHDSGCDPCDVTPCIRYRLRVWWNDCRLSTLVSPNCPFQQQIKTFTDETSCLQLFFREMFFLWPLKFSFRNQFLLVVSPKHPLQACKAIFIDVIWHVRELTKHSRYFTIEQPPKLYPSHLDMLFTTCLSMLIAHIVHKLLYSSNGKMHQLFEYQSDFSFCSENLLSPFCSTFDAKCSP